MTARRILFAGWLAFVLYGFPGYMRGDAIDELFDARVGSFSDWHSPMHSELWRICERLFAGPALLFLVQGTLLLLGSYALLRRAATERKAAIASSCVLIFPPILATTAVICADATLVALLVAGLAILTSQSRYRLWGLALMAIAGGMMNGAPLAVLPLVLVGMRWPAQAVRLKQLGIAFVVWLVMAGFAAAANYVLVDGRTYRPDAELAMLDIVGTLAHAKPIDDATIKATFPGVTFSPPQIQAAARSAYRKLEYFDRGDGRIFEPVKDGERAPLVAAGERVGSLGQLAYVKHRVHIFMRVLGFSRDKRWRPFYSEFLQNRGDRPLLHHAARHSLLQKMLIAPVRGLARTPVFAPYLYFALAILLLVIAAWRRHGLPALLLLSALSYEVVLGVVTVAPDFRNADWLIVTTVLSAIIVAVRELEARHERIDQQAAGIVATDDRIAHL